MTAMRHEEIRILGRDALVPADTLMGRTTIVTGKLLRVAQVMDEDSSKGRSFLIPLPPSGN